MDKQSTAVRLLCLLRVLSTSRYTTLKRRRGVLRTQTRPTTRSTKAHIRAECSTSVQTRQGHRESRELSTRVYMSVHPPGMLKYLRRYLSTVHEHL
jgi:hypothetical protein